MDHQHLHPDQTREYRAFFSSAVALSQEAAKQTVVEILQGIPNCSKIAVFPVQVTGSGIYFRYRLEETPGLGGLQRRIQKAFHRHPYFTLHANPRWRKPKADEDVQPIIVIPGGPP